MDCLKIKNVETMKNLATLFVILSIITVNAQDKYLTKTGTVTFEASVPSFEEVAAKNNSVTAILNTENNEIAALVLVKGFRFKNALMEEHFNENYAESNLYPKATFKGQITGQTLNGELTFHGVTKPIKNSIITITKENENLIVKGNFSVDPLDYNIEIPKIVQNKISNTVNVKFSFVLEKKI